MIPLESNFAQRSFTYLISGLSRRYVSNRRETSSLGSSLQRSFSKAQYCAGLIKRDLFLLMSRYSAEGVLPSCCSSIIRCIGCSDSTRFHSRLKCSQTSLRVPNMRLDTARFPWRFSGKSSTISKKDSMTIQSRSSRVSQCLRVRLPRNLSRPGR